MKQLIIITTSILMLLGILFSGLIAGIGDEVEVYNLNNTIYKSIGSHTSAMDGDGNFVITWSLYREDPYNPEFSVSDIFTQRFNTSGHPLDEQFQLNSFTYGIDPSIAMNKAGRFAIASISWLKEWQENAIYVRLFDKDGTPLGSEFKINQSTENIQSKSISMDGEGNFVVVWKKGKDHEYDFYARRYNKDGIPLGNEFKITDTTKDYLYAIIAMNESGEYVIGWSDKISDVINVHVQKYDITGNKIGEEILVNNETVELTGSFFIDMNDNGNFVVSWIVIDYRWGDRFTNSYWTDIFARRFIQNDSEGEESFLVNTNTSLSQVCSTIALANDDSFIISWYSQSQDSEDGGVYAQRFDGTGNKTGREFRVNKYNDEGIWNYNYDTSLYLNIKYLPIISSNRSDYHLISWRTDDGITISTFDNSAQSVDIFPEIESSIGFTNIKIRVEVLNPIHQTVDLYTATCLNNILYWYPSWDYIPVPIEINGSVFEITILDVNYYNILKSDYTFYAAITEHGTYNLLDLDSVIIRIEK
jgi:hypothetical protein